MQTIFMALFAFPRPRSLHLRNYFKFKLFVSQSFRRRSRKASLTRSSRVSGGGLDAGGVTLVHAMSRQVVVKHKNNRRSAPVRHPRRIPDATLANNLSHFGRLGCGDPCSSAHDSSYGATSLKTPGALLTKMRHRALARSLGSSPRDGTLGVSAAPVMHLGLRPLAP